MKPYSGYVVRLGDLKQAIVKNPYDPTKNIDGYMRYLKYNTSEVQPEITKGNWINENFETIECSNCNHTFDDSILLNADEESFWDYPSYCPNCGAYMKGEQDE